MRWFKPVLRNSISALLGSDVRMTLTPQSLEPVRQAMLALLGEDGAKLSPELKHRLSYLPDAHALWFARSELVQVLSRLHGEVQAVDMVRSLSPAFSGLLPRSLTDSANRAPR